MAATPQRASFIFVGASGRTYSIDAYLSDVNGASVTFSPDGASGTGTATYWQCPETVTLVDYAQVTGTADTTALVMTQNQARRAGAVMRYTIHLTSLNNRPRLGLVFPPNSQIGATQLA